MSFEDRLRARIQHAAASVPDVPVELGEVLGRGHRARRVTMALAAGAAALVAGLALWGATELLDRTAPAPVPPSGDEESAPVEADDEGIESVLRSWLGAAQDGDADAAWALMSPESRADVGRARFEDMMESELPEGIGAYAAPGVDVTIAEIPSPERERALVATLSGRIEEEGQRAFSVAAVAMTVEGEHALVDERFADVGVTTAFTSASLGVRPFRAGDVLDVELGRPDDVARLFLAIDGGPSVIEARTGHAPRKRWTAVLDQTLEEGLHGVTIVIVDRGGRVLPQARVFEAAAP